MQPSSKMEGDPSVLARPVPWLPLALVLFFSLDKFGLSGVFGDGLEADAADRMIHTVLIDLVEELADGQFSGVRHDEAYYDVTPVTFPQYLFGCGELLR